MNFCAGVPIGYADAADLQVHLPLADGVLKDSLHAGQAREQLPPSRWTAGLSGPIANLDRRGVDKRVLLRDRFLQPLAEAETV